MNYEKFKLGRVFSVPLLGGGYAFGYLSFFGSDRIMIADVFDRLSDKPIPPIDVTHTPIIIYDMLPGPEFFLRPSDNAGGKWKFTDVYLDGPVTPHTRHYRMGTASRGYRRVDILDEDPDVPLSAEEAETCPRLKAPFPPYLSVEIEIAVKRLDISPDDFIASWRKKQGT